MGEVQQVQPSGKERHGHEVPVTIDNRTVEIQAREYSVAQLSSGPFVAQSLSYMERIEYKVNEAEISEA